MISHGSAGRRHYAMLFSFIFAYIIIMLFLFRLLHDFPQQSGGRRQQRHILAYYFYADFAGCQFNGLYYLRSFIESGNYSIITAIYFSMTIYFAIPALLSEVFAVDKFCLRCHIFGASVATSDRPARCRISQ